MNSRGLSERGIRLRFKLICGRSRWLLRRRRTRPRICPRNILGGGEIYSTDRSGEFLEPRWQLSDNKSFAREENLKAASALSSCDSLMTTTRGRISNSDSTSRASCNGMAKKQFSVQSDDSSWFSAAHECELLSHIKMLKNSTTLLSTKEFSHDWRSLPERSPSAVQLSARQTVRSPRELFAS